ncbi:MAG: single-stranded DNA-binding protein [Proteobacteria bacterium]|nr:single-stranded DNA-binding protein [Pseudomonadota bacterium]
MAGVNKVILVGRLGRDPEMTYTPSGMAVCKFSIATSKKRKDGNEVTAWHRCTAFGKSGEIIGQYMSKGRELYVEGEIQYGQYEKDGITRYTTDIIVNQFTFIGGRGGGQDSSSQDDSYQNYDSGQGNSNYQNTPQQGPPPQHQMPPDDDIPF